MAICQSSVMIGLSVYYVTNISVAYIESEYVDRFHKMRQAYREQGGRLLKSSIIFILSAVLLGMGKFTFCREIGGAIMGTVINSLIGLIFFGAVQHICGPERGSGALAGKKASNLKEQQEICMKLETNF